MTIAAEQTGKMSNVVVILVVDTVSKLMMLCITFSQYRASSRLHLCATCQLYLKGRHLEWLTSQLQ